MTTYFVTRDTDNDRASDEDRAMAHVSIYRGESLTDALAALKRALRDEADDLTHGREVTDSMDVWAFKRAVAMMELANDVASMDPHQGRGRARAGTRDDGHRQSPQRLQRGRRLAGQRHDRRDTWLQRSTREERQGMITPLPDGWAWTRTHVAHSSTFYDNARNDESSTTIEATFRVNDATLSRLYPYPDAPLAFIVDVVDAKWTATGEGDPTLISISLAGPAQARTGGSSRLNRLAFRNEIALVRSGAAAAETSTLPQAVVRALDNWAAIEGNLPVAVVQ